MSEGWVVTRMMPFSWWIRDFDVSAGMNNARCLTSPPPPLLSTSCLQPFTSPLIITEDHSLCPSPSCCPHLRQREAAFSPSSGQPCSQLLLNPNPIQKVKSCKRDPLFRAFPYWTENGKTLMQALHYPITAESSAAIGTVWQLHPWVTRVIRWVGLTDKMADEAGDGLSNQNVENEGGARLWSGQLAFN